MNDYQEKIQFVAISLAINDLNALILLVIIRIRKLVGKTKCNLHISYYFLSKRKEVSWRGRIHFLDNDFPDNDFPDNDFPDKWLSRQTS